MSAHECADHLLVIHAEGSDTTHKLEGVLCPCLPRVLCAVCDRQYCALGSMEGRELKTKNNTVHVYPAWQERQEREAL